MKKGLRIFLIIIGIFAIIMIIGFFVMFIQMGASMDDLVFYQVDLDQIENGIYEGSAETPLVKVKVEVEVRNNRITNIDLIEHQNGLGSDAEIIIEDMVDQNTYDVDAISGATASSQVIKSAVSDALAN